MTQTNSIDDYFEALERLKKGRPTVIPKDSKITNDAVASEAGRGKGSIKKSRPMFANLIIAIDQAAAEQASPQNAQKERLAKAKLSSDRYRLELEASQARELSLLNQFYELKKELMQLTGKKVLPLRGHQPQSD